MLDMKIKRTGYFLIFLLLGLGQVQATQKDNYKITTVATDMGIPWAMAFVSNDTLLVTDRDGYLTQLDLTTGKKTDISGLPWDILSLGQGGLLDVALPPNYAKSAWIYFSYSKDIKGQGTTTLARAKLEGHTLIDWQDIFVSKSISRKYIHFAGRITFDDQGHVFLSIGDRGVRPNAQDLTNHAGSIIRLRHDGRVPTDNPFVGNDQILDEIWSYGHRNPQGLWFNARTQHLWSIEHGPRGGDEINLIQKGRNYGWPIISYGKEYMTPFAVGEGTHKEGMEQPIKVFTPSIAPSSLIQYQGDAFPNWKGNLLSGALKLRHLNRVVLDKNNQAIEEIRLLESLNARIRALIENTDGLLYLSTDDGKILRLEPNNE